MHATVAKSPWKRLGLLLFSMAMLLGCVLLSPPLSVPMAFIIPLLVCPGRISMGRVFGLLLPLIPCVGMLLAGMDVLLSLLLLPGPYLCLLAIRLARSGGPSITSVFLILCFILMGSQALWWLRVVALVGGDLFAGLAGKAVASLSASPNSGNVLYQMVNMGFLTLPAQFQQSLGFRLGNLVLLDPRLRAELLKELLFLLQSQLRQGIPALLVQSSLVVALFTVLRTLREMLKRNPNPITLLFRVNGRETRRQVVPYPSFRSLRLPPAYRGHLLMLAVGSLVLRMVEGPIPGLMSDLMMAAFTTVYQLLGAATLIFLLTAKEPRRAPLGALLSVAVYLLFPTLLFLLGLADQFLNLRAFTPFHQEEDS